MASYQIKSGDTLSALAAKFGTTVQALAQANGIANPNVIKAGATLTIPSSTPATPSAPANTTVNPNANFFSPGQGGNPTPTPSTPTMTYTKAQYDAAVAAHPTVQASGVSTDDISNAMATGDWSKITAVTGQPFSSADQNQAVADATAATQPYYDAERASDTEGTANSLAGNQLDYNKALADNAASFQTDKTNQDQTAANNGVLFSGGRAQKLNTLANNYRASDAYNQSKYGQSIANTAGNYAYKYGSANAGNPTLSQYYQLGSNNYNPNVASGGVTPGGLSTIYNAGNYSYQGTETNAAKAAVQTAAAGLLANKANKLAGSYNNSL